jgi:hypothetical protein
MDAVCDGNFDPICARSLRYAPVCFDSFLRQRTKRLSLDVTCEFHGLHCARLQGLEYVRFWFRAIHWHRSTLRIGIDQEQVMRKAEVLCQLKNEPWNEASRQRAEDFWNMRRLRFIH